jgi:hypothetical protein
LRTHELGIRVDRDVRDTALDRCRPDDFRAPDLPILHVAGGLIERGLKHGILLLRRRGRSQAAGIFGVHRIVDALRTILLGASHVETGCVENMIGGVEGESRVGREIGDLAIGKLERIGGPGRRGRAAGRRGAVLGIALDVDVTRRLAGRTDRWRGLKLGCTCGQGCRLCIANQVGPNIHEGGARGGVRLPGADSACRSR